MKGIYKFLQKKENYIFPLLIFFLVLIIFFSIPKVYESTSIIQLGYLGQEPSQSIYSNQEIYTQGEAKNIIESNDLILQAIKSSFQGEKPTIENFKRKNLEVKIVTERDPAAQIKETRFIEITTKAGNPETSLSLNEHLSKGFIELGNSKYERIIKPLELGVIKKDLEIIEIDKKINSLIEEKLSLPYSKDSSQGALKIASINSLLEQYEKIKTSTSEEKFTLEREISKSSNFKIISSPQLPEKASSPKLSTAIISALILSILTLIFITYREKRRE